MDTIVNYLTLGGNLILLALMLRGFSRVRELLRDVNDTKLDIADLTERFTTFQKREGMRAARAVKHSEAEVQAELLGLTKGVPLSQEPENTKDALRRKLRGH